MSQRIYTIYVTFIGVVCIYVIVRSILFADALTLRHALIQGALVGFGLAVVTVEILARVKATKVNGWASAFDCGLPTNGMFTRAAHARLFPGPVNVPEEAIYWWTHVDGAGLALSGEYDYVMHFPPAGLPPNDAFWSLTMANARNRFVENPISRYAVNDRSGLAPNADGSLDIYIQHAAPAGHESNWLPAPTGAFNIWLRAYMPGKAILEGTYTVPPVERVR